MRTHFTPKQWLMAATLLALAAALVALWHSNQTLLAVVRAEHQARPATPRTTHQPVVRASSQQKPAPPVTANPATAPAKTPRTDTTPRPPADPVVITDHHSWTFAAGYLESAEDGLLHFGGGIGLAYMDGTWLTGERADIAFNNGDQEATTITIPNQATLRVGNYTVNIEGDCVIQSTNGQITSISAD
ncbi:MAG: hypothetical protein NTY53_17870, partial [Kiritimatiellaeota bacterium]|nr:hypothetical protein [Kiritimatiellota bacterium]